MKSHKKLTIFVVICCIACVALLAGIYYRSGNADNANGVTIDKSAENYDPDETEETSQMISFPGNEDITIGTSDTSIPIVLANPDGNPCTFQFDLSLEESDALSYTSGLVEPGKAIKGVTLDEPLPVGDYTLDINISTSSLTDQSPMNGGTVKTALHVIDDSESAQ